MPERIAVLRLLKLGDMLCAVPALKSLRTAFPSADITLIGLPSFRWMSERYDQLIDGFIPLSGAPGLPEGDFEPRRFAESLRDIRSREFDLVVQMHGDGTKSNPVAKIFGGRATAGFLPPGGSRTEIDMWVPYPGFGHEIHRLLLLTTYLGGKAVPDQLDFKVSRKDFHQLKGRLGQKGSVLSRPFVCLHPGANDPARRWSPDSFVEVGRHLETMGFDVIVTGRLDEAPLVDEICRGIGPRSLDTAFMDLPVGPLAGLLSKAALLITNDTGISHLGVATRTPSVVLFTNKSREDPHIDRWAPLDGHRHVSLCGHEETKVERVIDESRALLARYASAPCRRLSGGNMEALPCADFVS